MASSEQFANYPSLRDRVVIVTGGATGIGEALVHAFAMKGAREVFLEKKENAPAKLIEKVGPSSDVAYYHCDLINIAEIKSTVASILERFGTVDVLVNNAGNDARHKVLDVTQEFWDQR